MHLSPADIAEIEHGLCLGSQEPCGALDWLDESARHPEEFWRAVKRRCDERFSVPSASRIFEAYNFYHDILLRNRNNPAPALCWYEPSGGMCQMTYNELADDAAVAAGAWMKCGVVAGSTLCLVGPMGPKLVTDLMAGLKIGCRICYLFPHGKRFLENRLDALGADHIAADPSSVSLMPSWKEKVLPQALPGKAETFRTDRVHIYPAGESVFSCFDPAGPEPDPVPADVSSDAAYLCALRDGLITLGIGPGQRYAAPGFDPQETLPALLLSGLLSGATYLHLRCTDIAVEPGLVSQAPVRAFGVSRRVRDQLLATPPNVGEAWHSWFRNPAEAPDMDRWHRFTRELGLTQTLAFNAKWCPPVGGCALFSLRRRGMAHMKVLPAPGCAWHLADMAGGDFDAPGDGGMCRISPPLATDPGSGFEAGILIKAGREWLYGGGGPQRREGKAYPGQEVMDALTALSKRRLIFFSLVSVPLHDPGGRPAIVLLVFTGPGPQPDAARLEERIRTTIASQMGAAFQPDRLAFFPLYPRFLSPDAIDHDWCRVQYLSGGLFRRSRGEIFRNLTRLRRMLLMAPSFTEKEKRYGNPG